MAATSWAERAFLNLAPDAVDDGLTGWPGAVVLELPGDQAEVYGVPGGSRGCVTAASL